MAADTPRANAVDDAAAGSPTPLLEIVLGALGGLIVVILAGFLLWSALQGHGRGVPDVRLELLPPTALQHGWLVAFRAVNEGGAVAGQLHIEAQLEGPDGSTERSQVVIDYLGGGSIKEGGFLFTRDPALHRLTARPTAFTRP